MSKSWVCAGDGVGGVLFGMAGWVGYAVGWVTGWVGYSLDFIKFIRTSWVSPPELVWLMWRDCQCEDRVEAQGEL